MNDNKVFELKLEMVKDHELQEIAELAKVIWHDHYTSIIGKEQIEYMLNKFYSEQALKNQLNENQVFRFIYSDDKKIGFIATTNTSPCKCFINKFYILSGQQSQSIGTLVMDKLKTELRQSGCSKMKFKLTVNRQNFKAINFYFKNGFKIESVADFDIGNGYEMNDFIMVMHSESIENKG